MLAALTAAAASPAHARETAAGAVRIPNLSDTEVTLSWTDFKTLFGATHGFEIPFVFNRFRHLGDADRFLFQRKTRDDRERLSRMMGSYWASFARDGVPSCVGAPAWPVYGEAGGSFVSLDTDNDGGITVVQGPESLDALAVELKRDPRIDPCLVVDEMDKWMFTRPIREQVKEATGCE